MGGKRITIESLQALAADRGGKCLSAEYVGLNSPLLWECNLGHQWNAPAHRIKSNHSWCPKCSKMKWGIEDCHRIAAERHGKCLAMTYVACNFKLEWECAVGHRWQMRFDNVLGGSWCPECHVRKTKYSIISAIDIAKKNGGECLTADYVDINATLVCRCKNGHEWNTNLKNMLEGHWCRQCVRDLSKMSIEDARKVAEERGGKCLSSIYDNAQAKLKWECEKGHMWEAPYDRVSRGGWCLQCRFDGQRNGIDFAKQLAANYGGVCLAEEYVDAKTKIKWKCKEGHEWLATASNIVAKHWCKKCAEKERNPIEDLHKIAAIFGGQCLSTTYENRKSIVHWRCKNGHEWKAKACNAFARKWCPRCKEKSQNILAENIKKLYPGLEVEQKYRGFEWLNTEKGGRQEIDIWVDDIYLAIEYDGQGHFFPVNFGGCSDETAENIFNNAVKADKIKTQKIAAHPEDVRYFIRFAYTENIFDINAVRNKLLENNIPVGGVR